MRLSMSLVRHPALVACALSVATVAGAGCGEENPFVVTDSFTPPPEGAFAEPVDSLHDYVAGGSFFLDVRANSAFTDLNKIEVVSKDPDVLDVKSTERIEDFLRVKVKALEPGTAALAFLDADQIPLEERVVEVKRPDEVVLTVNIDGDKGFTVPSVKKDALLIAQGGKTTFRVAYRANGKPLSGVGVLTGTSDVVAAVNPTRENPHREFLTLQAPADPTPAVPVVLEVDGRPVRTLEVRTADLDEIKAIELDQGDQGWKWNGSTYAVWAKAFDKDAKPIFGAPFSWDFDGGELEGDGDLLFYEHAGGERRRVQVRAGDEVEDVTVEAKKGSGKIESTADPGCASAMPGALVALLALLRARATRRRAARRGTLPW